MHTLALYNSKCEHQSYFIEQQTWKVLKMQLKDDFMKNESKLGVRNKVEIVLTCRSCVNVCGLWDNLWPRVTCHVLCLRLVEEGRSDDWAENFIQIKAKYFKVEWEWKWTHTQAKIFNINRKKLCLKSATVKPLPVSFLPMFLEFLVRIDEFFFPLFSYTDGNESEKGNPSYFVVLARRKKSETWTSKI